MKIVVVDLDRCFGCRHCQWACAFRRTDDFKLKDSSIRVDVDPQNKTIFTSTCFQCETASCLEVCPANALNRDPQTNAVIVVEELCNGCELCIDACSFGNMHFDNEKCVATKCNLCNGDPQCVKFCMAKALRYDEA